MSGITYTPPFTGEILEFGQPIVGSKRELKKRSDVESLLYDSCKGFPPEIRPVNIMDSSGNKLTVAKVKELLSK